MRLDVAFTPLGLAPADVQGRTVFVIDVLRATTTICAALHHGARAVIPTGSTEEAMKLAQTLGSADVLLAGERNTERIPGFALGNSPLEMTEAVVKGKTLVMTTTNGTRALLATAGARESYLVCAANFSVAGARAMAALEEHGDLLIVCAGTDHQFALDDAYAAGRLVLAAQGGRRRRRGLNDAALASLDLVRRYGTAWARAFAASRAGRELAKRGFKEDVLAAAREDAWPVLPIFHERRVTLAPTPAPLPADSA
ncbi:MAG: 2-phosphosulfolactate phosphatase [Gemmatimonadota bacterium]